MKRIIILVLVFFTFQHHALHHWTILPSFTNFGNEKCLPIPKEGGNCVPLGDKIYCKNGYLPCFNQAACGQSDVYQEQLFSYEPANGKWDCSSPPNPTGNRAFAGMWSQESSGSVFFGFGVDIICAGGVKRALEMARKRQIPINIYSDFWKVKPGTNTWTNLTATMSGTPGPRLGPGYSKISDSLFAFTGGLDGGFSAQNDMFFYNVHTNTWTQIQPTVHNDTIRYHGRFNARFECSSSFPLCVIAFGDTLEGVPLNDVWTFNTQTFTWTLIAPTAPASATQPGDRVQFCSFLKKHGTQLYLYVGFGDADDETRCTNGISGYGDNPTKTHWRIRVDVPGGVWENVTTQVSGQVRPTKSPACCQVDDTGYMVWGHQFACPISNTTGFPLPNQDAYALNIPNP